MPPSTLLDVSRCFWMIPVVVVVHEIGIVLPSPSHRQVDHGLRIPPKHGAERQRARREPEPHDVNLPRVQTHAVFLRQHSSPRVERDVQRGGDVPPLYPRVAEPPLLRDGTGAHHSRCIIHRIIIPGARRTHRLAGPAGSEVLAASRRLRRQELGSVFVDVVHLDVGELHAR